MQAANGALSDQDRAAIDKEWAALLDVTRSLVADTAYNEIPLLDGSFTPRLETVTRTETVLVDPGEPPSVSVEPASANAGFGAVGVSGTPLADATYELRITRDATFTPSQTQVILDPANRGPGRIEPAPSSNPTTQTSYEIRIKEQNVRGFGESAGLRGAGGRHRAGRTQGPHFPGAGTRSRQRLGAHLHPSRGRRACVFPRAVRFRRAMCGWNSSGRARSRRKRHAAVSPWLLAPLLG